MGMNSPARAFSSNSLAAEERSVDVARTAMVPMLLPIVAVMPSIVPTGHYCRQCDTELWSDSAFTPVEGSVRCPRCGSAIERRGSPSSTDRSAYTAKHVAIARRRRPYRLRDISITLGASGEPKTAPTQGSSEDARAQRTRRSTGLLLMVSGVALAALVIERSVRASEETAMLTAPLANTLAALGARAIVSLAGVFCALRLLRTGERLFHRVDTGTKQSDPPDARL